MTKIDKNSTEIDLVTIRFAGDSGDGMQLTGNQFTTNSALFGNDIEITLFKYIDEIDKAVNENPPDILGLSNYCWSHNVSYEIFKMCKKINPIVVTIFRLIIILNKLYCRAAPSSRFLSFSPAPAGITA